MPIDVTFSAPNVIVKPPILTRQVLEVAAEGELVAITIGNSILRLHYEDALRIAQWIRFRAKEAKRWSGDNSRHWSAIGQISSLEEIEGGR